MTASQTRSQAVRQSLSLNLRIEPSPYNSSSKVVLTAHTPSSAAMAIRAEADAANPSSESSEDNIIEFSVLCHYEYVADESGLMSFKKGEILDIIKRDDTGWWAALRQEGPVVGWIPQAYVTPLSEEMAEKLRSIGEEFRVAEYEAEQLYNTAPVDRGLPVFEPDFDSVLPEPEDDPIPRKTSSYNLSATYYQSPRDMYYSKGRRDENVNPFVQPQSSPRSRPNPPPSPTSPMPYPPSRPAYQAKPTSPIPISEADSRQRSGSTSSNRSLRRRPVILNDNPTLSRLSTLIESNNTKEIDELASPDIVGSFEAISKRSREGRTPKRRASEDTKYTTNVASQGGKPWYLLPQYRDQLDEDSKGNIRTGTLEALVERLTTDVGTTDPTKIAESKKFTSIFLMTFRTFTTANRLFDMLLDRFNIQPPKNLTDPERKDWKANLCLPVQRRVLDVLTVWLEDHRLLEEEPYISKHLTEFLNAIDGPPLYLTATAILKSLERLTFTVPSSSTTTSPKKSRKSKAHKNDLLKIDPSDVAEQLTVLESSLYMKITPQECLTYAKTQSGGAVAKLSDFIGTHDKLGAWVKLSVLNLDTLVKRAETVDFWIKVAEKCRVLNNFASMSSIIIALSSVVISRLHVTWGHVGRKSQLDVLLRYNEPTGGFAGYRQLLNTAEGPCVPFITMFLTDIIHAYEQFDSQEGGQIYFFQRARWHEIITKMLKFQSRPYCLPASESTMNFIEGHLRDGNQRDQNWYWNRSQELQHSELAHADIRKGLEAAGF